MKKQILKNSSFSASAAIILGIMLFAVYSCKKDMTDSATPSVVTNEIDLAELKTAYNSDTTFSKLNVFATGGAKRPMITNRNIKWDHIYYLRRDSSKVIEFDMEKDSGLWVFENGPQKSLNKNSLVFLQFDNGKKLSFYMKVFENMSADTIPVIGRVHYNGMPAGFNGEVLYYDMNRQLINGYKYTNGKIVASIMPKSSGNSNNGGPAILSTPVKKPLNIIEVETCLEFYQLRSWGWEDEGPIWCFVEVVNDPNSYIPPSAPVFGDGGSGSGPSATPPPICNPVVPPTSPPPSKPPIEEVAIRVIHGQAVVTNIIPDCPTVGTPPPAPPTSKNPIDKLIKSSTLTNTEKTQLQSILDQITSNCLGQALYDYMVNNNKSFYWTVNANASDPASYNPNNGYITIKDLSILQSSSLQEELLHAYQNFNIPGGSGQYHTNYVGSSNIEFETKLLRDMNAWINALSNGYAILSDPNYFTWLNQITNNGKKFPSSYADIQSGYFTFLTEWQNEQFTAQNSYKGDVVDPNLLPISMFSLINSSSCSK